MDLIYPILLELPACTTSLDLPLANSLGLLEAAHALKANSAWDKVRQEAVRIVAEL